MSRLPVDRYTFPWGDAEVCPCGSELRFVDCCKRPGRLPYVTVPSLMPPGPLANYAHPACYLASTNNCSTGRSREHYVSEAILARFEQLSVSGMPWQNQGEVQNLPANALAANVLCERHNGALSPIDSMGLRAFEAFLSAADYAVHQRHSGRAAHFLISGEALELWMFKLMAGIHFGGIAKADGRVSRDNHAFPLEATMQALTTSELPKNAGLIVTQNSGLVRPKQISVAPLITTQDSQIIGVRVQFGALTFETTIVPPPISASHRAQLASLRRPRVVDFAGQARDARVVLTWLGGLNEVRRVQINVQPDDGRIVP